VTQPDINHLRLLATVLIEHAQERERASNDLHEAGRPRHAAFNAGYAEGVRFATDAVVETLDYFNPPASPELTVVE
jgi:hypothetical protein